MRKRTKVTGWIIVIGCVLIAGLSFFMPDKENILPQVLSAFLVFLFGVGLLRQARWGWWGLTILSGLNVVIYALFVTYIIANIAGASDHGSAVSTLVLHIIALLVTAWFMFALLTDPPRRWYKPPVQDENNAEIVEEPARRRMPRWLKAALVGFPALALVLIGFCVYWAKTEHVYTYKPQSDPAVRVTVPVGWKVDPVEEKFRDSSGIFQIRKKSNLLFLTIDIQSGLKSPDDAADGMMRNIMSAAEFHCIPNDEGKTLREVARRSTRKYVDPGTRISEQETVKEDGTQCVTHRYEVIGCVMIYSYIKRGESNPVYYLSIRNKKGDYDALRDDYKKILDSFSFEVK